MSGAEAAKALGITPRTLHRFIDQGDLAAFWFGRVIRLEASDVAAFVGRKPAQGENLHLVGSDCVVKVNGLAALRIPARRT